MLHQRTSSAINLRMESSRRHAIRNLKAKVRSLLPIDICQKERRRYNKSEKLDELMRETEKGFVSNSCDIKQAKKNSRIFQKLSKKQIEEINQNKHYFLGNQESISLYETYVKECYPQLIQNQWTAPKNLESNNLPFAFIPSNLINPIQLPTYKKIASQKKIFLQKRQSDCKSLANFKRASTPLIEDFYIDKRDKHASLHKAQKCLGRKQALEEELKIKRQISSVHLQRQQKQAQNKRKKMLKQRTQTAKYSSYTFHGEKYNQRALAEDKFIQSDINNLVIKLRKVCLKKKKPEFDLDLMDSRVCKKIYEMGINQNQMNS